MTKKRKQNSFQFFAKYQFRHSIKHACLARAITKKGNNPSHPHRRFSVPAQAILYLLNLARHDDELFLRWGGNPIML